MATKRHIERPRTIFGEFHSKPGGLYNPIEDKKQTMLAYEANFYPATRLREAHTIVWHHVVLLSKAQILLRCNHDLTEMEWPTQDARFENRPFKIHWEYNNIPTEIEWNKVDNNRVLRVDYRISPLIKDGGGRVVLLGFITGG